MRTVNISYLYLEGDTEGSANSNRVRRMTPIHRFTVLPMGDAAGGYMADGSKHKESINFNICKYNMVYKKDGNVCSMETGILNARITVKVKLTFA